MTANGLASEADIKAIEQRVAAELDDCVEYADASPKPVRGGGGVERVLCCAHAAEGHSGCQSEVSACWTVAAAALKLRRRMPAPPRARRT